jgi:hypothetical protein
MMKPFIIALALFPLFAQEPTCRVEISDYHGVTQSCRSWRSPYVSHFGCHDYV